MRPTLRSTSPMTTTRRELEFRAMGSDAHLVVVGGPADLPARARARVAELERRWSRFLPDSEVSELTRRAGTPVTVSPDTVLLVELAVEAFRLSGGSFDPTVLGDVVRAGYDRSFDTSSCDAGDRPGAEPWPQPRSPSPLAGLVIGCGEIEIDGSDVRLPEGTGFDPGGIGKGLAADLVTEELLEAGAEGACLSLGGDVRVRGVGPDGEPWTVAVEHPWSVEPIARVGLLDGAVATSTSLKRRWGADGEVRHHLIDPGHRPAQRQRPDAGLGRRRERLGGRDPGQVGAAPGVGPPVRPDRRHGGRGPGGRRHRSHPCLDRPRPVRRPQAPAAPSGGARPPLRPRRLLVARPGGTHPEERVVNSQLWWYTARSAGVVSWVLLAASVILGLALSTRALGRRARPNWLLDLHRFLGGAAVVFVGVHVVSIMFDSYVHFGLVEVLVPFTGSWHPAAVAWGIVGMYLLLAVEVTSLLRKRLSRRAWRLTHFLSFPLFAVATVHMLAAGTDRRAFLLRAVLAVATLAIAALTAVRVAQAGRADVAPSPTPGRPGSRSRTGTTRTRPGRRAGRDAGTLTLRFAT